ncbi:threonine synthase, partial [Vibrio parahaemolyticus]|nr:threonine synthase [Vibrio parahaemolyticus]
RNQGLYVPSEIPKFEDVDAVLAEDFVSRSTKILSALIGDELAEEQVNSMVDAAFQFPAPINQVNEGVYSLELFHVPTLAFKDFGGSFM